MIHAAITALWCLVCIALGLPLPCLFWFPAFYIGREHAQAEYRHIKAHGGKRENCPWWCGLAPSAWTLKGLLDFLLPFAVSMGALVVQTFFWR